VAFRDQALAMTSRATRARALLLLDDQELPVIHRRLDGHDGRRLARRRERAGLVDRILLLRDGRISPLTRVASAASCRADRSMKSGVR
jgi:hypothetical protein